MCFNFKGQGEVKGRYFTSVSHYIRRADQNVFNQNEHVSPYIVNMGITDIFGSDPIRFYVENKIKLSGASAAEV